MNNSELFDFLTRMNEDERSLTLKMPFLERVIIGGALILAGIWGTLMKLFIYHCLWQENLSKRPINILILMDQIIDHITKVSAAISGVLMVSTLTPIKCVHLMLHL